MEKTDILEFVQGEYDGYTDVESLGEWESFQVYKVITNEDTDGDGSYILADDEEIRFADADESDDLMHFFDIGE